MSDLFTGGLIGGIGGSLINTAANIGLNYDNRNWLAKREDTAVQRRVKDLRAAGINPILAAGQAATSQPAPLGETSDLPSIGELVQLRSAKADIAKTQAETELLKTQDLKEKEETKSTQIANQHYQNINPNIEADWTRNVDFNRQMDPIRILTATRQATAEELQNKIRQSENELQKINIDIAEFDKEMSQIKRDIMEKYGMKEAEADYYLKQASIWTADNERMRREYMDRHVWGSGSTYTNPDGSGVVGQVKQFINTILQPGRPREQTQATKGSSFKNAHQRAK